jgi:hypothetical protein
VRMSVYISVCKLTCMNTHIHICIHTHIHTYTHTHIHTYTHTHIHTYTHTHLHQHKHTHTYTIQLCHRSKTRKNKTKSAYIHAYIHTYTNTNTNTHIHTALPSLKDKEEQDRKREAARILAQENTAAMHRRAAQIANRINGSCSRTPST